MSNPDYEEVVRANLEEVRDIQSQMPDWAWSEDGWAKHYVPKLEKSLHYCSIGKGGERDLFGSGEMLVDMKRRKDMCESMGEEEYSYYTQVVLVECEKKILAKENRELRDHLTAAWKLMDPDRSGVKQWRDLSQRFRNGKHEGEAS